MKNIFIKIRKNSERGQAIILIAVAMVGLVAIVGLMVDGGLLLVEYARLKRGIDAASIAAAAQFRQNFDPVDLQRAGEEFLKFNQSVAEVTIYICDPTGTIGGNHDATICAPAGQPQRKLVRVTASRYVKFGFMPVVGLNGTTITATSVGEAASLDLVMVIDTSASMAYETTGDVLDPDYATNCISSETDVAINCVHPSRSDPSSTGHPNGDDPAVCNSAVWVTGDVANPGYDAVARQAYLDTRCEPLGSVIDVALEFVENQFYPYDRVAIISSTEQDEGGSRNAPAGPFPFMDEVGEIKDQIKALNVFQPEECPLDWTGYDGSCLFYYTDDRYAGQPCPHLQGGDNDPTSCGPSNIGGAMYKAGYQFAEARPDSFWVTIVLFGGPANATDPIDGYPFGLCPPSTWDLPNGSGFCRDEDSASRHYEAGGVFPPDYDADDYSRDAADFIASPTSGQGAVLFSICMGSYCRNYPNTADPESAENLGEYMALQAGGGDANHGLYFFAVDTSQLGNIFEAIAENIQTRISQ